MPNGLTILARRDTTSPVVAIVTWVRAGYFDEPDDQVGIAHVLEHMYFKGTPTRAAGEIARATKAAGGYLNAATIYDHTHYYTVLPAAGFASGLAVQADAFANSVIDADELARELEVIIEETKRKADTPAALAVETLFEVLHDRHRIRRWRMGREAGLRALTRDQLLAFYRRLYRPANTVLAIVGDVDPDEAIELASRHYGALPGADVGRSLSPAEVAPPGVRVREWDGDIAQAELVFGWRTAPLLDPASPALDILATVLAGGRASRLSRAVRDRRLAASVSAYNYTPTELGVFVVHAGPSGARMADAAAALWDQLRRVRAGEVTEVEIDRARRVVEAQALRRFESPEGQANFLGAWELQGDWQRGVAYHEALLAVDAAQVTAAARRWLDPEQVSIVAYRPRGTAPLGGDPAAVRARLEAARPAPLEPTPPSLAAPALVGRGARLERTVDGVQIFRTTEDVPILVRRRPGAALVHLGCFMSGGVVEERDDEGGLASLAGRAMLRGTARRTAARLAEDAEQVGGSPAARVGTEAMQWTISVPARAAADASELLADIVLAPTFPVDGVEAERAAMVSAMGALRDDMYRQPMRLATEAAWPAHPYGRPTLGTEASLARHTSDALAGWHAARVAGASAVLVAVGDADPQALADLITGRFASLRGAPSALVRPAPWPLVSTERVEAREKAQSAIALLFPGPARDDATRFDLAMLAGVASGLGGRLFEELRSRRSLAYTVLTRPFVRRRGGAFAAYIATSVEKEAEARAGLLEQVLRLTEAPVTDEELTRARQAALGAWQMRQASGASVLGDLADAWLHGTLAELTAYPATLAAVTPARILDAARRWIDPARRVEGIVRGRVG